MICRECNSTIENDCKYCTNCGVKVIVVSESKSGANWFFWIAALTVINSSVIAFFNSDYIFVIGLGATQIIDYLGYELLKESLSHTILNVILFTLDMIIIGIFVLFGIFARKRYTWAYIVGMVLYSLDAFIFIWLKDFLSFGFHLFALYFIYHGLILNEKYCAMLKNNTRKN